MIGKICDCHIFLFNSNPLLKGHFLPSCLEVPHSPRGTLLVCRMMYLMETFWLLRHRWLSLLKITLLFSFIFPHTRVVRFFEPGFFLPYSCVAPTLGHGDRWTQRQNPNQFSFWWFISYPYDKKTICLPAFPPPFNSLWEEFISWDTLAFNRPREGTSIIDHF